MGFEAPEIVYKVLYDCTWEEEGHSCHKILQGVYDTPHSPPKKMKGQVINAGYLWGGEDFDFWVFHLCTVWIFYSWGRVLWILK